MRALMIAVLCVGCSGNSDSVGSDAGAKADEDAAGIPEVLSPSEACPADYQVAAPADGWNEGFAVSGEQRSFILRLPEASSLPRPLLLMYHGTTESTENFLSRSRVEEFVAAGFIVVAPKGEKHGTIWPVWDAMRATGDENRDGPDLEMFDDLVACTRAHFHVDERRMFVTGHSAGGIMTNFLLRRRSNMLAGGIPASGVFDRTAPEPAVDLQPMAVLVTWGGDNDSVTNLQGLPEFDFHEQAVLASRYYEAQTTVEQVWCRGDDLGHAWLRGANDLMIDFMLSHPKGEPSNWVFQSPDASENFSCGDTALELLSSEQVSCPASSTAGCQGYCSMIGDCVVENATLEPVLGPQLSDLGFVGTACGGCISRCESDAAAGGQADVTVLGCMQTKADEGTCGPGLDGAMPFIDGVNACCLDQTQSKVCERICSSVLENTVAKSFFEATCAPWAP